MKPVFLLLFSLYLISFNHAQNCETRSVSLLNKSLSETSGLLHLNGAFITFNDSGGKAELYEIDTANGSVLRTIKIDNATNVDWEAIAADDDYIYIGDIGNNKGNRTNLKVYKIAVNEFEASNSIKAKVINFKYANQTTFVSKSNSNRFDAEAMANVNGNLLLFSKNWQTNTCLYYNIPKTEGSYSVFPVDSLATPGKVTGAVCLPYKSQLFLIGYGSEPFVQTLKNFTGIELSKASSYNCFLDLENSMQVEGICATMDGIFYTSEYISFSKLNLKGEIGEITYAFSLGVIENISSSIKVKTTSDKFHFQSIKHRIKQVEVFDNSGHLHSTLRVNAKSFTLNKSDFSQGSYNVQISLNNRQQERIKLVLE